MMRNDIENAFSIVELLIVIGIMGILATLAVPQFKSFQVKAKIAEATTNLSHIWKLQESYKAETGAYGNGFDATGVGAILTTPNTFSAGCVEGTNKNDIGFRIAGCENARYNYTISLASPPTLYSATAMTGTGANNRVAPGAPCMDIHNIFQDKATNNLMSVLNCLP